MKPDSQQIWIMTNAVMPAAIKMVWVKKWSELSDKIMSLSLHCDWVVEPQHSCDWI